MQQPMAMVLLRFYRHSYERLRQLRSQADKSAEDLQEMDRLTESLERDEPEPTFLQRLEAAWRGTLTSSGDPVWDRWMEHVREGNIPDEWYGPLKQGVKG